MLVRLPGAEKLFSAFLERVILSFQLLRMLKIHLAVVLAVDVNLLIDTCMTFTSADPSQFRQKDNNSIQTALAQPEEV
jgi:hypothetical protein